MYTYDDLTPVLSLADLKSYYRFNGRIEYILDGIHKRYKKLDDPAIFIKLLSKEETLRLFSEFHGHRSKEEQKKLPLYGVPFAVKDNIDVKGIPTTAACPSFSYIPQKHAVSVEKLLKAGALLVGKTNMDQFATGLVGVRSPFGIPKNPFNPEYIPGGSSSGSAVAVSNAICCFSLGTDTAGSGRVPASFNNIIGLKPPIKMVSNQGVVPAVASLDCVSVFGLSVYDVSEVLKIISEQDLEDILDPEYQKGFHEDLDFFNKIEFINQGAQKFRLGVPGDKYIESLEDPKNKKSYQLAVRRFESLGWEIVPLDLTFLNNCAKQLYEGPWVAERYSAVGEFIESKPDGLDATVEKIIKAAGSIRAHEFSKAIHQNFEDLKYMDSEWKKMDAFILPTTPSIYKIEEVKKRPVELNSQLGTFTNFANLLQTSAISLPAGHQRDDMPTSITLFTRKTRLNWMLKWADDFFKNEKLMCGKQNPLNSTNSPNVSSPKNGTVHLAVVGAHLKGQPLHWQIEKCKGRFVETAQTESSYELFEITNSIPPKPALRYVGRNHGKSYSIEIYSLPYFGLGQFMEWIPAPLGIGTIFLESGESVKGFICEPVGFEDSKNISRYKGWKAYLRTKKS